MGNSLRIDPRTLPRLFAWYAADSINGLGAALPADAATVSTWKDLSGNGRDLTAAGTPSFRVAAGGLNGVYPAVRFAGGADAMSVAIAGAIAKPISLVAVCKNTVADDALQHGAFQFNQRLVLGIDWLTNNKLCWADDQLAVNVGPAGDSTLWHVMTLMAQPVGPITRFSVDGVLFTTAGATGTPTNSNIDISTWSGHSTWIGDIAEAMIFTGEFAPCIVDAVRQALAEKYGLLASQTLAGQ